MNLPIEASTASAPIPIANRSPFAAAKNVQRLCSSANRKLDQAITRPVRPVGGASRNGSLACVSIVVAGVAAITTSSSCLSKLILSQWLKFVCHQVRLNPRNDSLPLLLPRFGNVVQMILEVKEGKEKRHEGPELQREIF